MSNKTILITGATSGIGESCAYLFAKHSYNLILTGRRQERLEEISKKIKAKYSVDVQIFCFDVRDRDKIKGIVSKNTDLFSRVDILLNNAGLALGRTSFQEGDESDWDTMIDTNLKGMIAMTKELIPFMIERRRGHIINISSTAARDVYPGGNVYSATKFAVDGLTKSLRLDLLPYKIKVSSITPGMVDTEFSLVRFKGDKEKADNVYKNFTPLHAEDIADAIYYMASRPEHVHIADIVVTCTAQGNSTMIHREP